MRTYRYTYIYIHIIYRYIHSIYRYIYIYISYIYIYISLYIYIYIYIYYMIRTPIHRHTHIYIVYYIYILFITAGMLHCYNDRGVFTFISTISIRTILLILYGKRRSVKEYGPRAGIITVGRSFFFSNLDIESLTGHPPPQFAVITSAASIIIAVVSRARPFSFEARLSRLIQFILTKS